LHSSLAQEFGEDSIFMDTAAIEPAANWPREIEQALVSCCVVIVAIGPSWIRAGNVWGQRRIDDRHDWTRRELEFALHHKKELLPILFREATMPPPDKLPHSVRELVNRQAVQMRDAYWDHDVQLVLKKVHKILGTEMCSTPGKSEQSTHEKASSSSQRYTGRKRRQQRTRKEPKAVTLYCNFCGKTQDEVKTLIAGPSIFICDECSDLCSLILDERASPKRLQDVSKLCRISVEAQSVLVSYEERTALRDRMQELAGRIRGARRAREMDLVAGCRLVKVIGAGNLDRFGLEDA
jgi:hypothetical protein